MLKQITKRTITFLCVAIVVVKLLKLIDKLYRKYRKYPIGPFYLRLSSLTAKHVESLTEQYGSLIMFHIGFFNKCILINDINLARKAFINDQFCNHNHQLTNDTKYSALFENVNGEQYDYRRNLIKMNLSLDKYAIDKVLDHYLFPIWDSYSFQQDNLQFFPTQDLLYLSFFIIFTSIFGFKYIKVPNPKKTEYQQFIANIREKFPALSQILKMQTITFPSFLNIDKFMTLHLFPFNKQSRIFKQCRKQTLSIIDEWIKQFEETYDSKDDKLLIIKLLSESDSDAKRLNILCDLEALFEAGCFANSNQITNTLVLLAKHQDIQQRIFMEIEHKTDDNNCHLLKAFIYESLRITGRMQIDDGLLGTNGVARFIMNDNVTLNGYNIPKHSKVFALCGLFNNDSKYFANPNKFDISHFLDENGTKFRMNTGFCRFGIGKRNCIAQIYVIQILCYILPKLMLRYKFIMIDTENNDKKEIKFDAQGLKDKLLSIPLMVERRV